MLGMRWEIPADEPDGEDNFDRCQIKNVVTRLVKKGKNKGDYDARLRCDRVDKAGLKIESDFYNDTQGEAYDDLKRVAGKLVCERCSYAGMDRREADEYNLSLARIANEHEQLEEIQRIALEEIRNAPPGFPEINR